MLATVSQVRQDQFGLFELNSLGCPRSANRAAGTNLHKNVFHAGRRCARLDGMASSIDDAELLPRHRDRLLVLCEDIHAAIASRTAGAGHQYCCADVWMRAKDMQQAGCRTTPCVNNIASVLPDRRIDSREQIRRPATAIVTNRDRHVRCRTHEICVTGLGRQIDIDSCCLISDLRREDRRQLGCSKAVDLIQIRTADTEFSTPNALAFFDIGKFSGCKPISGVDVFSPHAFSAA